MEQIAVRGLNFSYPESGGACLKNINLSVDKGDFVLLFGKSGCGKSTFLKQLKPSIAPFGKRSGTVTLDGKEIETLSQRDESSRIGYVSQDPDNQIVTDKVWHELAFGLESLGYGSETIRLRVAEMSSFFGIQGWFFKPVIDLSGGQKQILNLASVMVMQPEILLLDEPTSQLDPVAASGFIRMLKKINDELGVTILISEHRLEEVLPVCSRTLFMEDGAIRLDTEPGGIGGAMKKAGSDMYAALPACVKIYAEFNGGETPVTVKETKYWLERHVRPRMPKPHVDAPSASGEFAVVLRDIWFRYDRKSEDAVKGASCNVPKGVLYSIVGGNGVGKSTLLSVIGGVRQPYRGKVFLLGRELSRIRAKERYRGLLGFLPQDPRSLFRRNTVRKDLEEMAESVFPSRQGAKDHLERAVDFFQLEPLLERHPYDLSGGEQECAALAKVLLTEPQILLLDEPTKGIDAVFKEKLSGLLTALKKAGKTIILVSHDIDFCAACSDFSALMFNGEILAENPTGKFFAGNGFYTTSANRIARGVFPDALTCEDVIRLCRENSTGA